MHVQTALFFETPEQIYRRVFALIKPRTPVPEIAIRFRPYANANSRINLRDGHLSVDVSDLLESAPAPIQEALAHILISKLFRKIPERSIVARYRQYLNRVEVRHLIHRVKQHRGRKLIREPGGKTYDLTKMFEELNETYFSGLVPRPTLGWSLRPSHSTLGHFDPSHDAIVLSCLLDSGDAPELAVRYVLFHEMLHLLHPTEHRSFRRCVHTRSFKAAERTFKDYRKAKSALRQFLESVG